MYYLLKFQFKKQNIKKYWKMEKDTGKVREKWGNFVSPEKVGTLTVLNADKSFSSFEICCLSC